MAINYPSEKVNFDGIVYPFGLRASRGDANGHRIIHKFGHNHALTTTYGPVSAGGVYNTPQVGGEVALRVKAGNANDTAAGTGAREVTLYGLDATGAEISESVATAGSSASAVTTAQFLRLFKVEVSASGTYGSAVAGSHAAAIVIETATAVEWATIPFDGFGHAISQIGAYTIPIGYTGYVSSRTVDADSSKPVDFLFMVRENILETAAPYPSLNVQEESMGVLGPQSDDFQYPLGPFPALTDIGYMARGATTPAASVDFHIILIAD